jgi:outer membrane immunogenic protein
VHFYYHEWAIHFNNINFAGCKDATCLKNLHITAKACAKMLDGTQPVVKFSRETKLMGEAMRRALFIIIAVSGCLAGAISLAQAADMATKARMPAKGPMAPMVVPVPVYNWTGCYIGGNGGYGWSDSTADVYDNDHEFIASGGQNRRGGFGGGQIGCNYMVSPNFLIGVEGDYDWASLTGSSDNCTEVGCVHNDGKTKWFATARGRIGYAANDWLFFATGGAAWTNGSGVRTITASSNSNLIGLSTTGGGTHSGWTAGGGIEYGFAPGWSAVLEYIYIQTSGTTDYIYASPYSAASRHSDVTAHLNTVRLGVNYHFNWMH